MHSRSLHGTTLGVLAIIGSLVTLVAQSVPSQERVDLDAVYRIKDEGLQRSQVMDTAWYLTEVHGPRLTNSPAVRAAADLGEQAPQRLGRLQCAPGDLGAIRPRLGQRQILSGRCRAAAVSADRVSARVDARHQRPRHGRGGRRADYRDDET